jgi:hypothetical protein
MGNMVPVSVPRSNYVVSQLDHLQMTLMTGPVNNPLALALIAMAKLLGETDNCQRYRIECQIEEAIVAAKFNKTPGFVESIRKAAVPVGLEETIDHLLLPKIAWTPPWLGGLPDALTMAYMAPVDFYEPDWIFALAKRVQRMLWNAHDQQKRLQFACNLLQIHKPSDDPDFAGETLVIKNRRLHWLFNEKVWPNIPLEYQIHSEGDYESAKACTFDHWVGMVAMEMRLLEPLPANAIASYR